MYSHTNYNVKLIDRFNYETYKINNFNREQVSKISKQNQTSHTTLPIAYTVLLGCYSVGMCCGVRPIVRSPFTRRYSYPS